MDYKEKIGTKDQPLSLQTPPLSSAYTMHVDEKDGKEILYVQWVKPFYIMISSASMTCMIC